MGGFQGSGPSLHAFPGHKQGTWWEAGLPGLELAPIWDSGTWKARILANRLPQWAHFLFLLSLKKNNGSLSIHRKPSFQVTASQKMIISLFFVLLKTPVTSSPIPPSNENFTHNTIEKTKATPLLNPPIYHNCAKSQPSSWVHRQPVLSPVHCSFLIEIAGTYFTTCSLPSL